MFRPQALVRLSLTVIIGVAAYPVFGASTHSGHLLSADQTTQLTQAEEMQPAPPATLRLKKEEDPGKPTFQKATPIFKPSQPNLKLERSGPKMPQPDLGAYSPIERGEIVRNPPFDCTKGTMKEVVELLGRFISLAGGISRIETTCNASRRELFTGVTLGISTSAPPNYPKIGGRGEIMADAGVCALASLEGAPLKTTARTRLGPARVTSTNTIDYLYFDRETKTFYGYQNFELCGPVLGCIDLQQQGFEVQVVRKPDPVREIFDLHAGSFPIRDGYALLVGTEEAVVTAGFALPPIIAPTPLGPITVTPYADYAGALRSIDTPFTHRARDKASISFTRARALPVKDLYGRVLGRWWSARLGVGGPSVGPVAEWHLGHGWSSQVAFGSRSPIASTEFWNEPVATRTVTDIAGRTVDLEAWPIRPDLSLTEPRDTRETEPQASFNAGVNIVYDPRTLLPAPIKNILSNRMISVEESRVFVNPNLTLGGNGQFNMAYREGFSIAPDMNFNHEALDIKNSAGVFGSLDLNTGVDLKIVANFFIPVDIINIHPRAPVHLGGGDPKVVTDARAVRIEASFDPAGLGPKFERFAMFDDEIIDGATEVARCLANTSRSRETIPAPTHEPGRAEDLIEDLLYPCNICAVWPRVYDEAEGINLAAGSEKLMPSATPVPPGKEWECNNLNKGCYDLCSLEPDTSRLLMHTPMTDMDIVCGIEIK